MAHHTSPAARGVAIASAFLLVLASAGFGALFAWTTGSKHGPLLGALSVAMALGLEGAKPFAVAGTFTSLRDWRLGEAFALTAVGGLAVLFSLTAELTFMAMTRGDLVAERSGKANVAKRAEARYARADADLKALAPARSAAELAPLISKLKSTPGANGCEKVDGKISRGVCAEVADLQAEAARDTRRRELEATMREAEEERSKTPAVVAADPGASALSVYAATVGFNVSPELLSLWLPLIGVLALEVGAAFAVLLVKTAGPVVTLRTPSVAGNPASQIAPPAMPQATPAEAPPVEPPIATRVALPVPQRGKAKRPRKDDDQCGGGSRRRALGDLLGRLQNQGGEITATSRGLAALLGTSKGTVHRVISDAMAAGMIRVEATMAGTRIALA